MSIDGLKREPFYFPCDHERVLQLLEACRVEAFQPSREDQCWKEWWILATWFSVANAHALVRTPLTIQWLDKEGEADFICGAPDDEFRLEVTEATDGADRKAISARRQVDGPILIGQDVELRDGSVVPGGRFKNGQFGLEGEQAVASDVSAALKRKCKKRYAEGSILLLYANSNALWDSDDFLQLPEVNKMDTSPFRRVDIVRNKTEIVCLSDEPKKCLTVPSPAT